VYEVLLESQAEKDLKGLEREVFDRLSGRFSHSRRILAPGCRKLKGSRRDWRTRVGAYRVLYEIEDRSQIVRILRVRYRKDIYR